MYDNVPIAPFYVLRASRFRSTLTMNTGLANGVTYLAIKSSTNLGQQMG